MEKMNTAGNASPMNPIFPALSGGNTLLRNVENIDFALGFQLVSMGIPKSFEPNVFDEGIPKTV